MVAAPSCRVIAGGPTSAHSASISRDFPAENRIRRAVTQLEQSQPTDRPPTSTRRLSIISSIRLHIAKIRRQFPSVVT